MRRYRIPRGSDFRTIWWVTVRTRRVGFTLIELLVVIAIISILAAMLLPSLSRTKDNALAVKCRGNLRQQGIALQLYLDENGDRYPFFMSFTDPALADLGSTGDTWASWPAELQPYYKLWWQDNHYHCPAYKGVILGVTHGKQEDVAFMGSYAYNRGGTDRAGGRQNSSTFLGLSGCGTTGTPTFVPAISGSQVLDPSEMFAIGDARPINVDPSEFGGTKTRGGFPNMFCGPNDYEQFWPPVHANGYNALHCDGHVAFIKTIIFTNPTNAWQNYNNDHQPHKETWTR